MFDRNAYRQKVEAHLKEWKANLDQLSAKAEKAGADAQIRWSQQLNELNRRYDDVKTRLGALTSAGEQAVDDARRGLEGAVDEFRKAYERATSREGAEHGAGARR